jgi:hypothetical protein
MNRPQRTTRASLGGQGEHAFGTRRQAALGLRGTADYDKMAQNSQTSVSLAVILSSKDIKVGAN